MDGWTNSYRTAGRRRGINNGHVCGGERGGGLLGRDSNSGPDETGAVVWTCCDDEICWSEAERYVRTGDVNGREREKGKERRSNKKTDGPDRKWIFFSRLEIVSSSQRGRRGQIPVERIVE